MTLIVEERADLYVVVYLYVVVCSNSPGHMTKMAAMPISGKKP